MDLISRYVAIDAVKDADVCVFYSDNQSIDDVLDYTIRATKGSVIASIEQLPSTQSASQWIPVSEKLPEENDYKSCIECLDGAVWYCTENGTIGLGYYYKSTKEWSTTDDLKTDGKVVAWKPLPEPYQEEIEIMTYPQVPGITPTVI